MPKSLVLLHQVGDGLLVCVLNLLAEVFVEQTIEAHLVLAPSRVEVFGCRADDPVSDLRVKDVFAVDSVVVD